MNRANVAPPRARWLAIALATVMVCRVATASTGQLQITVVDKATGKPVACRMHLVGPKKKPYRPDKVPFWHDHFAIPGKIVLRLPLGEYAFVIERGPEYRDQRGHFTINHFADDAKQIELQRFIDMAADGWWSGDVDVRRPARDMDVLMAADDLHIAEVVAGQNDKKAQAGQLPKETLVRLDGERYYQLATEQYSRPGGELLLFNLPTPLKLSAPTVEYPALLQPLIIARESDGFWVDATRPYAWDVPLLVAAGQLNSIEVAHSNICRDSIGVKDGGRPRDRLRYPAPWGDAQWSQQVYFHLLECGLRIPPTAGSGSGEALNPMGYNRVYAHVDGPLTYEKWWEAIRAGRVVITNGPLLKPSVNGELPGHVFQAEAGTKLEFEVGLTLATREPISYLEIVKNGKVEHSIPIDTYAKSGRLPTVQFDGSGWFLVRAVTDLPKTYRFAMTGPYFVEMGYKPRVSKTSAQFFVDWVYERARQIKLADAKQQREVLEEHRRARDFWKDLLSKANAE